MDLEEIKITAKLLQNLAVGRVFKEHVKYFILTTQDYLKNNLKNNFIF